MFVDVKINLRTRSEVAHGFFHISFDCLVSLASIDKHLIFSVWLFIYLFFVLNLFTLVFITPRTHIVKFKKQSKL